MAHYLEEETKVVDIEEEISPEKKPKNLNKVARYVFLGLVLALPFFVLPLTWAPFEFSKVFLALAGTVAALLLWLTYSLQRGKMVFPKSLLLLALASWVLVWFLSSVFAFSPKISLMGTGYDTGALSILGFSGLAMFLVSILFSKEKEIAGIFKFFFAGALALFVLEFLWLVFGLGFLSLFFQNKTSSPVGSFNELAVFFGLTALLAAALISLRAPLNRGFLFLLLLVSFLVMAVVNFSSVWYVLGAFLVIFLAYLFSVLKKQSPYGWRLPLVLVAAVTVLIFANPFLSDFSSSLGISYLEIRPSWSSTFQVIKESLKENPLLGSGPNTFVYNWLRFKPESINLTSFWSVRFKSGVGLIPSFFAETGSLGTAAVVFFLAVFLLYGLKAVLYLEDNSLRGFLMASFLGSLYLWIFNILYSPGFLLFFLSFILTGIFVALLIQARRLGLFSLDFSKNPLVGFVSTLVIVSVFIASASFLYLFIQKYTAAVSFSRGLIQFNSKGNLDRSEELISRASRFGADDIYFRALSEIGLLRLQAILNTQDAPPDILQARFQNTLAAAIDNAKRATDINSSEPLNWVGLGRVYEAILPLGISGAGEAAHFAYEKAAELSPYDPSLLLARARIAAQTGRFEDAKRYLDLAIGIKSDYAPAHFLAAQLEAQAGNIDKAIKKTEETFLIAPNDVGVLFQLGLLYYQNNNYAESRAAFERAVRLAPAYSNARYFLGLIYDRERRTEEAIEQFEKIAELNPQNDEVKRILSNLRAGKNALAGISPPAPLPEERENAPIKEESGSEILE